MAFLKFSNNSQFNFWTKTTYKLKYETKNHNKFDKTTTEFHGKIEEVKSRYSSLDSLSTSTNWSWRLWNSDFISFNVFPKATFSFKIFSLWISLKQLMCWISSGVSSQSACKFRISTKCFTVNLHLTTLFILCIIIRQYAALVFSKLMGEEALMHTTKWLFLITFFYFRFNVNRILTAFQCKGNGHMSV